MKILAVVTAFIVLVTLYVLWIWFSSERTQVTVTKDVPSIPKIIHQTAPADQSKWDPIWFQCQQSWRKTFPDYQYILWNDESMGEFMKVNYPEFYPIYASYTKNIYRVDAARYFILYTYGGIYADMDFEVCRPFMHLVPTDKVSIVESPYKENEHCQNALMITPERHPFWLRVFKELRSSVHHHNVLSVAGPQMIDRVMKGRMDTHVLPHHNFNPHKQSDRIFSSDPDIYTKHYGTSVWVGPNAVTEESTSSTPYSDAIIGASTRIPSDAQHSLTIDSMVKLNII